MSLPEITVPVGTPPFLVAGHGINESDLFANWKRGTGHTRKRRLYTVPERRVAVSLLLESAQMVTFDAWFENALIVGKQPFSANVASQDGSGNLWWKAIWDKPYQAEPLALGRWLVRGVLLLTGEGSTTGPISSSASLEVGIALKGAGGITVPASIVFAAGMSLFKSQSTGTLSLGFALTKFLPFGTQPGTGTLVITGYAPTMTQTTGMQLMPGAGTLVITGHAPTMSQTVTPPTSVYTRGAEWVNSGLAVAAPSNDVTVECPTSGTIQSAILLTSGGTGSCVVDIWKTTYAAAPPTVANSICSSALPTITSGVKSKDTTLTGWGTAVIAGDVLVFHLVSSSTFTAVSIILEIA